MANEIKIVTTHQGTMGSDCTSVDKCHFAEDPTLGDFAEYLNTTSEWGTVYQDNLPLFEYGCGKGIVPISGNYEQLKDLHASLKSRVGGWGRMDYHINTYHKDKPKDK